MRKIYPSSPESLPAKPLKHVLVSVIAFTVIMLLATISPGRLFAVTPTITSFSPATGPVGTLVTINGTNLSTPTALTIGGKSAIVVSNTGSILVAMAMPGAATGAVSVTTAGGTANGSGNFTVKATPFPFAQQGAKLVGTNGSATAEQGRSVAISADGNTAIIGGFDDNGGLGAAWVFTRSGSSWAQQGTKLVGTGNTGLAEQGQSVSISADGNTAIVGGFMDNSGVGAAWIFTRSNSTWTQQGSKLVGTSNSGASQQGRSVALSADGNTAIVGGYQDDSNVGAAWIYTRSGGAWTQQGSKLVGTGNTGNANQGYAVSLSADGNTAIVGGLADNSFLGAAWVYTRSGGVWTQQGSKLAGTSNVGAAEQGSSVSLSADGNTAILGGYGDNSTVGAAWVFTRSGSAWAQQGSKLVGTDGMGAPEQGLSVSLTADGNTAIVGGINDNSGLGATWIYTRSGGAWTQQGSKFVGIGSVGSVINQGYSVAVSADGNTAIEGGVEDNDGQGAAWFFTAVASSNALLTTIKLTPASTLTNTGTVGTTTTYTTSVSNATASITVTPTAQDVNATIKVNGTTVASGTASGSIALAVGNNTINTVVTAQDATTTHTYSIIVTRVSNNALLSTIKLTPASTLTNTGTVGSTTTYTTTAGSATTSVMLTPTAAEAHATIKVNGVAVTSGTASGPIAIAVGQTTITTVVTAQDGTTTHTYSITVTRLSNNALLSSIKLTPASTLTNTGTTGTTTTYTTSASNATTSVEVTPTAADVHAAIKVNGVAVTSGTASGSIALAVGANTINTVVTAQDGTTTHTYSITVTRASGALLSLDLPVGIIQPTDNLSIENDGILVHQGISPNGDGLNDYLHIDGLTAYPDNKLTIIDRNGSLIFQAKGYDNISKVFDGHSGNGKLLSPGTYFYALDYFADGQTKHKTGFIILKF